VERAVLRGSSQKAPTSDTEERGEDEEKQVRARVQHADRSLHAASEKDVAREQVTVAVNPVEVVVHEEMDRIRTGLEKKK
jgi:hypothetical protein